MHIQILKPGHEHAGKPAPVGAKIEVSGPEGRWLIAQKIGKEVKPAAPVAEPVNSKQENQDDGDGNS